MVEKAFAAGLALGRSGRYFEAHEAFEEAWRAADANERDFFQGLVHVVVAWYQAGRGNRVGCTRQLEKATHRLGPYRPEHRGLDVDAILAQVACAQPVDLPALELPESDRVEHASHADVEPPLAVEEEE